MEWNLDRARFNLLEEYKTSSKYFKLTATLLRDSKNGIAEILPETELISHEVVFSAFKLIKCESIVPDTVFIESNPCVLRNVVP